MLVVGHRFVPYKIPCSKDPVALTQGIEGPIDIDISESAVENGDHHSLSLKALVMKNMSVKHPNLTGCLTITKQGGVGLVNRRGKKLKVGFKFILYQLA